MYNKKNVLLIISFVFLLSFGVGVYYGFHVSTIPIYNRNIIHKAILKFTYGIDRLNSIYRIPRDFKERWQKRLDQNHDKIIGVYIGHGIDATPFLPIQLKRVGFNVKLISNKNISDIKKCSVFVVPGGHYSPFDLNTDDWKFLSDFVRDGGGYVGICLGVIFAKRIGLIRSDLKNFPFVGLIKNEVLDNEIYTGGYKLPSQFLHMNGPLLNFSSQFGEITPFLISGDNIFGGHGKYGKGRFVLFSSHPEGGKFEYDSFVIIEGYSLRTMDMLLDAIFYAMKD